MPATVNVHEAKTHFSKLLERAHAGEEIIVAKAGKPYAKLVKLDDAPLPCKRTPGGWPELAPLADDAMMSAMTDADIEAWEQKLRDI
ncbi:type II toxin-antitoxin system Phd/YefM family antitoxin [Sandarakinorhabdus sp. DWP1-3-1]|uniref:type II toxin-antitoxin system Phd/YefM family antitoxin n=1 Tax=Sandarakinorhabdus sp. DWP1-3-1 TaxID=2804627 RepID=UPI003CEB3DAA